MTPFNDAAGWEMVLPASLREGAYKSKAGNEYAWPRGQALEVLEILNRHGFRISGVEPWIPTVPGPTPAIFDWSASAAGTRPEFPATAEAFIQQFCWDMAAVQSDLVPHFNFSVDQTAADPSAFTQR